jgi:hypothetical protein
MPDKDEAAGSSPARPTTSALSCENSPIVLLVVAHVSHPGCPTGVHSGLRPHPCEFLRAWRGLGLRPATRSACLRPGCWRLAAAAPPQRRSAKAGGRDDPSRSPVQKATGSAQRTPCVRPEAGMARSWDDTVREGVSRMDIWLVSDDGVEQRRVEELQVLLQRKDRLLWVDIPECDEQAIEALTEVFGFHPLAIRDCVERNQVPKIHPYSDHLFVVLHASERGKGGHVHLLELDQFIGPNYLVTVHGPSTRPPRSTPPCVRPAPYSRGCKRPAASSLVLRAVVRHRRGRDPPPGGLRGRPRPRGWAAGAAGDER